MEPLRILHVFAAPYPSLQGSQVYMKGLLHALADRGHQVALACYGHGLGPARSWEGSVRLLRAPGLPGYRRLRSGPDVVKPLLDAGLALRVGWAARWAQVIHAHNYEAPLAAYGARALWRRPVVYTAHNTMESELPAYFSGRLGRRAARELGAWLDARIPRRADIALALSASGERALRRLGCRRVACTPPGVDLQDLAGACPERASRRYRLAGRAWVVYAGNPDAYQDADLLLRALARVPRLGLLLASHASLEPLRRRCDALGIAPRRRRLVRARDWPSVRDIVVAADFAALPRRTCAGFPIKLLNYLGLGKAVVAARDTAPAMAGVLPVPPGDPQAMAGAFDSLLRHPERCRVLGEAGRQVVRRDWSWGVRITQLEGIYMELLERRDGGLGATLGP